ncbi:hypothetical protein ACFLUF_02830, partial [Chloroflexota bacterium]
MKLLNSKKGTEMISDLPFLILSAIAAGFLVIILINTANVDVAQASKIPPNLEDELLLASRFYNSEKCFAYVDEVGRVHTKMIDTEKFTQENMDKCFPVSEAK